jgi:hypothetical protein
MCKAFPFSWTLMFAVLSLMAGCATVPPASNLDRELAISFTPHPESAGVYIFRPRACQPLATPTDLHLSEITLDHISVGQLGVNSFLYLPVAPGEHRICRKFGMSWNAAKFKAEAGKNYCFVDSWSAALQTPKVKPITEAEGKAYAQTFTLSSRCGPDWAEQFAAAQGVHASFVYDNVLPVVPGKSFMHLNKGVFASPPTIRYWAPRGGIGVIQAGLMSNLGGRR